MPPEGESTPLLDGTTAATALAPFTKALARADGTTLPQTIAHRGYRAAYPENSLAAFRGAVDIGAHALETDVHLSKDKVVVLSHDPSLKRCFGKDEKIADCDWSYLQTLRTVQEPHEPLARLSDLLEYLAQPERDSIWVLLDIKTDDDGNELVQRMAETIAAAPAPRPWKDRIVLGCWNAKYIKFCRQHLPSFSTGFIGFSMLYARCLLKEPNVNFNMFQKALVGPMGWRFMADVRAAGKRLWVWTVNEEEWMEWSIGKGVDGVISDDPKLFLEVCKRWEEGHQSGAATSTSNSSGTALSPQSKGKTITQSVWRWLWITWDIVSINCMATVFTGLWIWKNGWPAREVKRELHSS